MRYETQADILRLLHMVSRHYAAVSLSLKADRQVDATRLVTLSCIACIADVLLRVVAVDVPSQFSLHYSGKARGPVTPYGFDTEHFAYESESLQFVSPEVAFVRASTLAYFWDMRQAISDDHVLFDFYLLASMRNQHRRVLILYLGRFHLGFRLLLLWL